MVSVGSFGGNAGSSTRPYLIRALHDWCTDNGFTPYIAVYVDRHVQVPMEYVKANEIVLNVGFEATSGLTLGNETIEFKARFGGSAREIIVPIDHVIAIYARENGQGMAFPVPNAEGPDDAAAARTATSADGASPTPIAWEAARPDATATRGSDTELQLVQGGGDAPDGPAATAGGDLLPEDPAEPPTPPTSPGPGPSRPALKRVK